MNSLKYEHFALSWARNTSCGQAFVAGECSLSEESGEMEDPASAKPYAECSVVLLF